MGKELNNIKELSKKYGYYSRSNKGMKGKFLFEQRRNSNLNENKPESNMAWTQKFDPSTGKEYQTVDNSL